LECPCYNKAGSNAVAHKDSTTAPAYYNPASIYDWAMATTPTPTPTPAVTTFTVTTMAKTSAHPWFGQGSGTGYVVNGVEGPTLSMTVGVTYTFTVNTPGHPFIRT
jgi:hypothetical protein